MELENLQRKHETHSKSRAKQHVSRSFKHFTLKRNGFLSCLHHTFHHFTSASANCRWMRQPASKQSSHREVFSAPCCDLFPLGIGRNYKQSENTHFSWQGDCQLVSRHVLLEITILNKSKAKKKSLTFEKLKQLNVFVFDLMNNFYTLVFIFSFYLVLVEFRLVRHTKIVRCTSMCGTLYCRAVSIAAGVKEDTEKHTLSFLCWSFLYLLLFI